MNYNNIIREKFEPYFNFDTKLSDDCVENGTLPLLAEKPGTELKIIYN